MPELTVVIPTYLRHDILRRTLAALERQTVAAGRFEVIVVDDPDDDDAAAVAAALDARHRPFDIRHLHRRVSGVSAARNVGWRAARAPLVLFLGDDILAAPDLVAQHLLWHLRHPDVRVGVLGHVRWADELRKTPLMAWLDRGVQFDYGRLEGDEAGWGCFYTSNVSVKVSMLERVEGFDEERFPFIYEDTDIGYRLEAQGLRLLYNRNARAEHLHIPTLAQWSGRMVETARAERRWIATHPEIPPHFERLFRAATDQPPAHGRLARALLRYVPEWVPLLGPHVRWHLDLYFRQLLAPAFLAAWDESEASAGASPGSIPGGPK